MEIKSKFILRMVSTVIEKIFKKKTGEDINIVIDKIYVTDTDDKYLDFQLNVKGYISQSSIKKLIDKIRCDTQHMYSTVVIILVTGLWVLV